MGRRFSGADVEGGPDRDRRTDDEALKRGTEGARRCQRTSGAAAAAPDFCRAGTGRKQSGWLGPLFSAPRALLRAAALEGSCQTSTPDGRAGGEMSQRAERPTGTAAGAGPWEPGGAVPGCPAYLPHTPLPSPSPLPEELQAGAPLIKISFSPFQKLSPISWS